MEQPTSTSASIENAQPQGQQITYTSRFPVYSTFWKYLLPSIIFSIISLISMYTMIASCLIKDFDPTNTITPISYICFMVFFFVSGYYFDQFMEIFESPIYPNTNLNPNEI